MYYVAYLPDIDKRTHSLSSTTANHVKTLVICFQSPMGLRLRFSLLKLFCVDNAANWLYDYMLPVADYLN